MGELFKDHDTHGPDAHDLVISILVVVGCVNENGDNVLLELLFVASTKEKENESENKRRNGWKEDTNVGETVSALRRTIEFGGSAKLLDVVGVANETGDDEDALGADLRRTTRLAAQDSLDLSNVVRDERVGSWNGHREDVVGVEDDRPRDHRVGVHLETL